MKVRLFQDSHEVSRLGANDCPWSVEWRENGRRRSRTIGSKKDAQEFATIKEAELLDHVKGIHTRKKWQDFEEEYIRDEVEASGKRPRTVEQARLILKRFREKIKPAWVHLIDARTLDTYRKDRLKDTGHHGGPISPHTVRKELRHIHAALGVAKRWNYLRDVPDLPKVAADEIEKVHVTEVDLMAMLDACQVAEKPSPKLHPYLPEGATAGDWWQALLVTCWITGARIDSILQLQWTDVDFDSGRVLSRAAHLKQRKDTRPEIAAALPYLEKIAGDDPRLLPWNHHKRTLYVEFNRIQKAAGIHLTCAKAGENGHDCNETCHTYGFHAFRYAHARLNYQNPQLQNQMGHACAATTERYKRWAAREVTEYGAYVPKALVPQEKPPERENAGKDDGKPALRLFTA